MYLADPPPSAAAERMFAEDREVMGYVMDGSRLWAHLPAAHEALFDLLGATADAAGLSLRQRGVLVTACASTLGDSYCSMAWGWKLAGLAGADLAAGVLRADDGLLEPEERALARWARLLAADPSGTTPDDVGELRDAGYDDRQIAAITAYCALRIAFSTVNDALGVQPEGELVSMTPDPVREAVDYGRPVARA